MPDAFNLSANGTIAPVVPMFHVNAWRMTEMSPPCAVCSASKFTRMFLRKTVHALAQSRAAL